MNFKGFKKVHQDGQRATFRHEKNGHEITIAHKSLSPKLKKQLDDLPTFSDGGPVKMASGGMPPGPCRNPNCHSFGKPHPNCNCYSGGNYAKGGMIGHKAGCPYAQCQRFDDGGKVGPAGENQASDEIHPFDKIKNLLGQGSSQESFDQSMDSLPKSPEEAEIMAKPPASGVSVASTNPTAGLDQLPQTTLSGAGQADIAPPTPQDPYADVLAANQDQLGAMEQEKQGLQGEAFAKGNMEAAQAGHEQAYQKTLSAAADEYSKTMAHLNTQDQMIQADIANTHIDPQNYINSMTSGGKLAAGIGLILGGIGAGVSHSQNAAFQYLQSQIDRDIDSQKADLGKKQNMLSHNIQLMGNARAGYDLTRLQHLDVLNSQLRTEAAKAGTPMAMAQAQAVGGQIDAQKAQLKHKIALQRAMMGGAGTVDPESQFQSRMQFLRMNNAEGMAKDLESKHVAGIPGQASVELTADNRSDLLAKHNFDQKLSQYIDFAKNNSGSLNPQTVASGKVMAAELQGLYRQATHGGVYKEGEANFINQLIDSNPTKFFNTWRGVEAKAQTLRDSNRDSLNGLKKSLGFPAQDQQATHPYEGKTATNSQGQRIVMKGGRWVPHGG